MKDQNHKADLAERLEFIGLGQEQRRSLVEIRPLIKDTIGGALDAFYRKVKSNPHTAKFFSNDAHIAHAKSRQAAHWEGIASGKYDGDYVDAVSAIGRTHARLGLEPRWYIGGYALVLDGIIRAVVSREMSGFFQEKKAKVLSEHLSSVVKAALLDMDYAISVYLDALGDQRKQVEAEREKAKVEQDAALAALEAALTSLAGGDLTSELWQELAPNFARLQKNYNASISELDAAMREISNSVEQVRAEADGISSATENMAKRTEQQASALEQTAAALEEITTISGQAAQRTREQQHGGGKAGCGACHRVDEPDGQHRAG